MQLHRRSASCRRCTLSRALATSAFAFAAFLAPTLASAQGYADIGVQVWCFCEGEQPAQGTIPSEILLPPPQTLCPGQIVLKTRFPADHGFDWDWRANGSQVNLDGLCWLPFNPWYKICCSEFSCWTDFTQCPQTQGRTECWQQVTNAMTPYTWTTGGNLIEAIQQDGPLREKCYAEAKLSLPTSGETGYLSVTRPGASQPEDSGPNMYYGQNSFQFTTVPTKTLTVCAHQAIQNFNAADKMYHASVDVFLKDEDSGTLKERLESNGEHNDRHCCKAIAPDPQEGTVAFNDLDVKADDPDVNGQTSKYNSITQATHPSITGAWQPPQGTASKKRSVVVVDSIAWCLSGPGPWGGFVSNGIIYITSGDNGPGWAHEYGHVAGLKDLYNIVDKTTTHPENFMSNQHVGGVTVVQEPGVQGTTDQCQKLTAHQ